MSNIRESRWVYVDLEYGGEERGWFTDAEKVEMDNDPPDDVGEHTWRELTPEEVEDFARYVDRLEYEQS